MPRVPLIGIDSPPRVGRVRDCEMGLQSIGWVGKAGKGFRLREMTGLSRAEKCSIMRRAEGLPILKSRKIVW